MLFSSLWFVFAFLPLCLIVYSLAKGVHVKNAVLLVFSLVFYAWGEPVFVLLLMGMTLADWLISLPLEKKRGTAGGKLLLTLACVINIGLLGFFKYGMLFSETLKSLTGFPKVIPETFLPIGISFYTFQLLTYVVDVYRGDTPSEKSYFRLLLYASLFHQCIAGPIVRYSDISFEILNRRNNLDRMGRGISRFSVGLAKKVLLADVCGSLADMLVLPDAVASDSAALIDNIAILCSRPALALWLGIFCFMLQIYLDFSAYSDMAIGLGLMVGFHYKENFDYPYVSRSVTEFWRRWHISLGTFFRDYLYIPLGGNRKGVLRTVLNLFIVWALTGLWHGASWNYALWGLYFFVFIVLEKLFLLKVLDRLSVISNLYLLLVVFFGWVLFRFKKLSLVFIVIEGMFMQTGNAFSSLEVNTVLKSNLFFLIVAVIAVLPVSRLVNRAIFAMSQKTGGRVFAEILQVIYPCVLLVLSAASLVGNSFTPFLYFQF